MLSKTSLNVVSNELSYLNHDTVILCLPNAMCYQSMANFPMGFYIQFFLNKKINVMLWNYKGYGRTKGTPDLKSLKFEAE